MIPPTNLTSLDKSVLILSTCLAATGVVLFALRAYAARKMNGKWRADFIWVSVAMALALGCYACLVAAFFYGLGHQLLEISYPQLQTAIKLTFAYLLMNITATATAKLGIVALIVSIQNPSQWQRIRFLWGVGVFQVIVNIVLQLCIIFACDPVTKLWNPLASGHCNIETTFVNYSVFQGAASGIVDLILGLWPISMMTVVKSSRKAKFGFCLLISLGIVPGAVSMYRALITRRVVQGWDVSYNYTQLAIWTCVELWLIIILGSVTTLRPLCRRIIWGSGVGRDEWMEPEWTFTDADLGRTFTTIEGGMGGMAYENKLELDDIISLHGGRRGTVGSDEDGSSNGDVAKRPVVAKQDSGAGVAKDSGTIVVSTAVQIENEERRDPPFTFFP